jgi:hypothetical protein
MNIQLKSVCLAAFLLASPTAGWATVVCANGNTVTVTTTGFVPTAEISAAKGNLPAGCDPQTTIFLSGGSFWRWNGQQVAAGGDKVSWTGSWVNGFGYGTVVLDADDGLSGLVTPTSPVASGALAVSTTTLSPTEVLYSIAWSGSDLGVAQRLRWYEYPTTPPGDYGGFVGDNTALPGWSSLASLRAEVTRVGPWSTTESFLITAKDANNLILALGGIAVSVPEPSTVALLCVGLVFAGVAAYRRRRAVV